jgi:hypothetical protein
MRKPQAPGTHHVSKAAAMAGEDALREFVDEVLFDAEHVLAEYRIRALHKSLALVKSWRAPSVLLSPYTPYRTTPHAPSHTKYIVKTVMKPGQRSRESAPVSQVGSAAADQTVVQDLRELLNRMCTDQDALVREAAEGVRTEFVAWMDEASTAAAHGKYRALACAKVDDIMGRCVCVCVCWWVRGCRSSLCVRCVNEWADAAGHKMSSCLCVCVCVYVCDSVCEERVNE